ncbi:hypothetical protein OG874_05905 [Nocardia sp. NBC_00565]|uniref:hypothetical protein n=1 Tax=Nocardia sp. NBC_00565 TaxID=2975993 RepID=UPI002E82014A|nr:hypothetical protein [Nocardia sp. NBC_00565]WUC04709.1 hypothetical protein OG874_05905 [Nocardia sp. NBC_00565]
MHETRNSLRVVDVEEKAGPSGCECEIQLRGGTVAPGYRHRDDLTHEVFTSELV